MDKFIWNTQSTKEFAAKTKHLRGILEPGKLPVALLLLPVSIALTVIFVIEAQYFLAVMFALEAVITASDFIGTIKMLRMDSDGKHRRMELSGNELVCSVAESGNKYQFYLEDIMAAVFTETAGIIYCQKTCIPVDADGFEEGSFEALRALIVPETAEKSIAYRKEQISRIIATAAVFAVAAVIAGLMLAGIL